MKLSSAAIALALALGLVAGPARGLQAQSSSDLFNSQVLHRLDLFIHTDDWAKLKEDFRKNEYYPVDLTWNGQTVRNAGVRSRGFGSRSGTKPSLKVSFDHYASATTFLGLKSLVLDNLVQDASGIHETVSSWFFSRFAIPAPRAAPAVLYVNGEYAGVYALIESIDKTMLARVFGSMGDDGQNDGYLYEFNKVAEWRWSYLGPGLEPYKAYFSPKTHETKSDEELYRPIEALIRLINEAPSSSLVEGVGPYLDLPGLVRYLAVENFLGENDGFLGEWGVNNFYLYRPQNKPQHVFIAWDDDLTFWGGPAYDLLSFHDNNVLMRKMMEVPELRALYLTTLLDAAVAAAEVPAGSTIGSFETEIRRELGLVDEAMRRDPVKPYSETEVQTASDLMRQYAPQRVTFVLCEVERLTGITNRGCGH
jgi:hypothetical protein